MDLLRTDEFKRKTQGRAEAGESFHGPHPKSPRKRKHPREACPICRYARNSSGRNLRQPMPGRKLRHIGTDIVDGTTPRTFNMTFSLSGAEVPIPAALPLFATGVGALGLLGWRRKRRAQTVG